MEHVETELPASAAPMETAGLISSSVEVVPITVELDVDRSLESVELLLSVRCWPIQLKEEGWSWRIKVQVSVREVLEW